MRINYEDDWNTNTGNDIIDGFRNIMLEADEVMDDPMVGIFWYDLNKKELFGVYSTLAEDTQFSNISIFNNKARTCKQLHYKIWDKNKHKHQDYRFNGDYTLTPRGRVFEIENEGFVVCCGSWLEKHPEVKELIIDEFQLPESNTKFITDIHWDIGHGWSDRL